VKAREIRAVGADVKALADHAEQLQQDLDGLRAAAQAMLDAYDEADAGKDGYEVIRLMGRAADALRRELP
jgi:outer membrane murein-binding lipoprotein Lpp